MTKINTVTTRQLGEMTIVGAFRLSEHIGCRSIEVIVRAVSKEFTN
jgi:hypothetical protein